MLPVCVCVGAPRGMKGEGLVKQIMATDMISLSAEGIKPLNQPCMNVYVSPQSLPGSLSVPACVPWRSPGGWWPGWRSNLRWLSPVPPADICGGEEAIYCPVCCSQVMDGGRTWSEAR